MLGFQSESLQGVDPDQNMSHPLGGAGDCLNHTLSVDFTSYKCGSQQGVDLRDDLGPGGGAGTGGGGGGVKDEVGEGTGGGRSDCNRSAPRRQAQTSHIVFYRVSP